MLEGKLHFLVLSVPFFVVQLILIARGSRRGFLVLFVCAFVLSWAWPRAGPSRGCRVFFFLGGSCFGCRSRAEGCSSTRIRRIKKRGYQQGAVYRGDLDLFLPLFLSFSLYFAKHRRPEPLFGLDPVALCTSYVSFNMLCQERKMVCHDMWRASSVLLTKHQSPGLYFFFFALSLYNRGDYIPPQVAPNCIYPVASLLFVPGPLLAERRSSVSARMDSASPPF